MFNFDQKLIDIDKIKLNPFNPRIGKANNMEFNGPELSQDNVTSAIKDILLGEDDGGIENISDKDGFRALQKSIQSIGTITNPIIIQKLTAKEENFEYLVVEGNTRLTIYRELHNNYSNTNEYDGKKWKFIPCHILNDTNKELYHKIQLTAHIVGPKSWDPYCRGKIFI